MYSPKVYSSASLSEELFEGQLSHFWVPPVNPSLLWREIRRREERVSSSEKHVIWLGNRIYIPEAIRKSFHKPNRIVNVVRHLSYRNGPWNPPDLGFNTGYRLLRTDLNFLVSKMRKTWRTRIDKLQPMGQSCPKPVFYNLWAKNDFYIFK